MSIVGPRPEDPEIVRCHYTEAQRETLCVRPGITSLGALYHYTHKSNYLDDADPEQSYIRNFLPIKLELERMYVERESIFYDLSIMARTVAAILSKVLGRKEFPEPPELARAQRRLEEQIARNEREKGIVSSK